MRLIGHFTDEKLAYEFHYFLLREGIQNSYEIHSDSQGAVYHIWVVDEDELPNALHWLDLYQQNPHDPRFQKSPEVTLSSPSKVLQPNIKIKSSPVPPNKSLSLTFCLIVICSVLFFLNSLQQYSLTKTYGQIALEIGMTVVINQHAQK